MTGLPRSTEVNRRVAKEKLYANANLSPAVRDMIKEQIESIIWRNKLADTTTGVAAGETVKELQVFELVLRQKGLDSRVLSAIAKAIPYKILFLLTHENEVQAWIEAAGTFYTADWIPHENLALKFEGLDLDAVYGNLARQIAGGRLGTEGDLSEAVDRDRRRQAYEREIALIEKKMTNEKQFNRQVELHSELKELIRKLEELNNG